MTSITATCPACRTPVVFRPKPYLATACACGAELSMNPTGVHIAAPRREEQVPKFTSAV